VFYQYVKNIKDYYKFNFFATKAYLTEKSFLLTKANDFQS